MSQQDNDNKKKEHSSIDENKPEGVKKSEENSTEESKRKMSTEAVGDQSKKIPRILQKK